VALGDRPGARGASGIVGQRRVGIFGGTFDPVHIGHLIIAEEARVRLALEAVLWVPARISPHKLCDAPASAAHRLRMVEMAVASNAHFRVSTMEIERDGPSYTVDTLQTYRDSLGPEVDLYFIMGTDSLEGFGRWREPERILSLCRLVVASRPGHDLDLADLERQVPGLRERLDVLDGVDIGISSTELRARVRGGLPIRYQVPEEVREYIAREGLYARACEPQPMGR
jgi:nicotinate-nucleotide adenylyltransferase